MSKNRSGSKGEKVFAKTDGHCAYCGIVLDIDWNVDHVIPKARGGSNGIDNLFAACPTCNMSKGAKSLEQFRYILWRRLSDVPCFSSEQKRWLASQGFTGFGRARFYFEGL